MRFFAVLLALLLPVAASAQQAVQPPFAPITVTQADAEHLQAYLNEQPMKFALPVAQWLGMLEQKARAEQDAKAAKTKPPAAPKNGRK